MSNVRVNDDGKLVVTKGGADTVLPFRKANTPPLISVSSAATTTTYYNATADLIFDNSETKFTTLKCHVYSSRNPGARNDIFGWNGSTWTTLYSKIATEDITLDISSYSQIKISTALTSAWGTYGSVTNIVWS